MTATPTFRFFTTAVLRTRRVTENFVRVTVGGPGLTGFGYAGADQRIKLAFPPRPGAPVVVPQGEDWHGAWLAVAAQERPLLRTYTVRAWRQDELDVDFVVHGDGPASTWARGATVGDELVLLGPDRPGRGRAWGREFDPPPGARVLLLGDETALPAVCAILAELAPDRTATALVEVPCAGDAPGTFAGGRHDVAWLARDGAPRGERLLAAVREVLGVGADQGLVVPEPAPDELMWEVPAVADDALHVWLAGEAGVVRSVRRLLLGPAGLPRSAVSFMGYWREGAVTG